MSTEVQTEVNALPLIEIDGALYNSDGEFVQFVGKPQFIVDSVEACDWVLNKILRAESEAAAILQTPELIAAKALIANAEKIVAQKTARIQGLHIRFDQELWEFAKTQIDTNRTKTFHTLFGSINGRNVPGGLIVADDAKALDWAKKWAPQAVTSTTEEKLYVSLLDKKTMEAARLKEEADTEGQYATEFREAFGIKPDEEKVTVSTGVETEARKAAKKKI